ncbi:MAG: hypothetical protein ACQEVA_04465 [Myxococcota bacterium]
MIFICSGNICRSPMAEVMAQQMFAERGLSGMAISMGTLGIHGRPAANNSIRAVDEIGIDLDGHRSQGVQAGMLELADRLVVMEPKHARSILDVDTAFAEKIVRLWEYVDEDLDGIPDPVGKDIEAFRVARDRIKDGLESWLDEIAGDPTPADR